MTTDLHDTALPRFEDRLWNELSDLHDRRQLPTTTIQRPRRPRRRVVPVAAVAVAAATALVVGLVSLPGDEPEPAGASVAERVAAATDAALADSVVYSYDDFISGDGLDREIWHDQTTGTSRVRDLDGQGAVVTDNGPAVAPQPGDVAPDLSGYDDTDLQPADCVPVGDGGELCEGWDAPEDYPTHIFRWLQACDATYADVEEPYMPAGFMYEDLRDELAAGHWSTDGTEVIEGRELLRLRPTPYPDLPSTEQTVYVDPETYLPVEVRSDLGGPDENITRFEYLPRTEENLALLSPPVPPGYTQVPDIPLAPCP